MEASTGTAVLKMSHTPLYQGYLFKESSFHKAFNKRYFVLYQDLLVYYKEEEQFLKKGTPEARLVSQSHRIVLADQIIDTRPEDFKEAPGSPVEKKLWKILAIFNFLAP